MTNRKSTTGFPTSYRCSATSKSPKGGSKKPFLVFFNKIQFQSNKVCYKVSLCKNFQQQSCSITIQRLSMITNMPSKSSPYTVKSTGLIFELFGATCLVQWNQHGTYCPSGAKSRKIAPWVILIPAFLPVETLKNLIEQVQNNSVTTDKVKMQPSQLQAW